MLALQGRLLWEWGESAPCTTWAVRYIGGEKKSPREEPERLRFELHQEHGGSFQGWRRNTPDCHNSVRGLSSVLPVRVEPKWGVASHQANRFGRATPNRSDGVLPVGCRGLFSQGWKCVPMKEFGALRIASVSVAVFQEMVLPELWLRAAELQECRGRLAGKAALNMSLLFFFFFFFPAGTLKRRRPPPTTQAPPRQRPRESYQMGHMRR